MIYSPLAVHCTSLCCDILQDEKFLMLSHEEINWFYDDVYELIQQRTELWPNKHKKEHEFVHAVTLGVLKALHFCKNSSKARNPAWLLQAMQSRISSTQKRLYTDIKVNRRYYI